MFNKILLAALCALTLSGCAAQLRGSPRIVTSNGVEGEVPATGATEVTLRRDRDGAPLMVLSPANQTFRQRFRDNFVAARALPEDGDLRAAMMRSGLLLIRTNCDDFFSDTAVLQRDADIGRDMIAPIISILTGIVQLRNLTQHQSDQYLQAFSLGSSAALAGISIVDAHFLFGAENVHEVRDLTFKALAAGEKGISDLGTESFEEGVSQLIDQQVICTPASILMRTRQAIHAGTVTPDTNAGRAADDAALISLARELGLTGAATPEQAAILWALYRGGIPAVIPKTVMDELHARGLDALVTAASDGTGTGTLSLTGATKQANLYRILGEFSDENKGRLRARARELISPSQLTREMVNRGVPLPPFELARTRGTTRRVELVVE